MSPRASRRRRASPGVVLNDVQTLVQTLGGDSIVTGIYDVRYGVNVTGALVDSWDDARGAAGFGPSLVKTADANRPTLSGTGSTLVITTGTTGFLQTAAAAAGYNLATGAGKAVFVGATIGSAAPQNYPVALQSGVSPGTRYAAFQATATPQLATPGGFVGTLPMFGARGATRRLYSFTKLNFPVTVPITDSTYTGPDWYTCLHGRASGFHNTTAQVTSESYQLGLGIFPVLATKDADAFRFVIILDAAPTRAQRIAIEDWALANHGVVFDTSLGSIIFDGNSITQGAGTATGANSYPSQMLASGGFAAYDGVNWGTGGRTGAMHAALAPTRIHPLASAHAGKTILIYNEFGNDIRAYATANPGWTATQLANAAIANAATECQVAKDNGVHVWTWTAMKRNDISGTSETARQQVNTALMAGVSWAHGKTDIASLAHAANPSDTTYFQDGIHPTTLLNGEIGAALKADITPQAWF